MGKRKTQEEFIEQIKNIWNITDSDFKLLSDYKGWDAPITFQCLKCGLIKTVAANALLKKNSHKQHVCKCYSYSLNWHEQLNSYVKWAESQETFDIIDSFTGQQNTIRVICKFCGSVQNRTIASLIKNKGCQVCELKQGIKKTETQFDRELYEKYGGEYIRIGEYSGATTNLLIKHTLCGKIYNTKPHYILTNKGGHCPLCKVISRGEKAIIQYLNNNNIEYIQQYRIDSLKKCPYDFYLPYYNLLIEYQGIQHFEPVARFGGKPSFLRQQEIDALKQQQAESNNYNLLIISYKQYAQISQILAQRLSVATEQQNAKQQPS